MRQKTGATGATKEPQYFIYGSLLKAYNNKGSRRTGAIGATLIVKRDKYVNKGILAHYTYISPYTRST